MASQERLQAFLSNAPEGRAAAGPEAPATIAAPPAASVPSADDMDVGASTASRMKAAVASAEVTAAVTQPPASRMAMERVTIPTVGIAARLVQLRHDGEDAQAFLLQGTQVDLGASEGEIQIEEDGYLSSRHARFYRAGGQWFVQDLGSVNRVFLRLRNPMKLTTDDLILFGQQLLRFQTLQEPEEGFRPGMQRGTYIFGAPIRARSARLSLMTLEGVERDIYYIYRAETALGREKADIVFTDDPFLSRRHALIRYDATTKEHTLEDLSSYNGTFLSIRQATPLADGDMLRIGLHLFRVEVSSPQSASEVSAEEGRHP